MRQAAVAAVVMAVAVRGQPRACLPAWCPAPPMNARDKMNWRSIDRRNHKITRNN
jgi:hypothetical protein